MVWVSSRRRSRRRHGPGGNRRNSPRSHERAAARAPWLTPRVEYLQRQRVRTITMMFGVFSARSSMIRAIGSGRRRRWRESPESTRGTRTRAEIAVRHCLIDGPRHHLQELTGIVRILTGTYHVPELLERQSRGLVLRRREVARHERPERRPAREVAGHVDLLGCAQECIRILRVGGAG